MILNYAECQKNARESAILYAARYPEMSCPTDRTFLTLVSTLRESASIDKKKRVVNEVAVVNNRPCFPKIYFLSAIEVDSRLSTPEIPKESGINQTSLVRILYKHKLHPYRMELEFFWKFIIY